MIKEAQSKQELIQLEKQLYQHPIYETQYYQVFCELSSMPLDKFIWIKRWLEYTFEQVPSLRQYFLQQQPQLPQQPLNPFFMIFLWSQTNQVQEIIVKQRLLENQQYIAIFNSIVNYKYEFYALSQNQQEFIVEILINFIFSIRKNDLKYLFSFINTFLTTFWIDDRNNQIYCSNSTLILLQHILSYFKHLQQKILYGQSPQYQILMNLIKFCKFLFQNIKNQNLMIFSCLILQEIKILVNQIENLQEYYKKTLLIEVQHLLRENYNQKLYFNILMLDIGHDMLEKGDINYICDQVLDCQCLDDILMLYQYITYNYDENRVSEALYYFLKDQAYIYYQYIENYNDISANINIDVLKALSKLYKEQLQTNHVSLYSNLILYCLSKLQFNDIYKLIIQLCEKFSIQELNNTITSLIIQILQQQINQYQFLNSQTQANLMECFSKQQIQNLFNKNTSVEQQQISQQLYQLFQSQTQWQDCTQYQFYQFVLNSDKQQLYNEIQKIFEKYQNITIQQFAQQDNQQLQIILSIITTQLFNTQNKELKQFMNKYIKQIYDMIYLIQNNCKYMDLTPCFQAFKIYIKDDIKALIKTFKQTYQLLYQLLILLDAELPVRTFPFLFISFYNPQSTIYQKSYKEALKTLNELQYNLLEGKQDNQKRVALLKQLLQSIEPYEFEFQDEKVFAICGLINYQIDQLNKYSRYQFDQFFNK